MDILALIKEKLTDSVIEKVSNFLGEHPQNISLALNNAVPTVLGGIIHNTTTEDSAAKLMDVLKDGGHTGEILEDLPSLLGNFDKTQLLITIGTNIFTHFLANKSNGIIETVSALSNIRKTSASSLVGLSTPLVLGALGKVIGKEGMGVSGLMRLLNEQREAVLLALPPALVNKITTKEGEVNKKTTKDDTKDKKKTKETNTRPGPSGGGASIWIPWILLALVLIAILLYLFKYKQQQDTQVATTQAIPQADSTQAPKDTSNSFSSVSSTPADSLGLAAPSETVTSPPVTPDAKSKEPEKKEPEPIKVPEKPVNTAPVTNTQPETKTSVEEELKNSTSWVALPNLNFKKGSAEISSKGDVDALVKFLKKNSKASIIVAGGAESNGGTLGEDRAYALRDVLFEKGIDQSRIQIQSSIVKDVNSKITVKVKK